MVPRAISHSGNLSACCLEQESIQGPSPSPTFNYSQRHASQTHRSLLTLNSISLSERAKVLKFCFAILSCATTQMPSCTQSTDRVLTKVREKNPRETQQCKKIRFKYTPFTTIYSIGKYSFFLVARIRKKKEDKIFQPRNHFIEMQ
jgi:hypothetical protein